MDTADIGSITNPVNSEEFLPPASCRHKRGDMDFVKSQQAERERMVCAVGLDVHYELNVLSGETGSYQPRLRPFNPRMSGPACPYNYTGKFLGEASINDACDDPIELGRKIHALTPYDAALYRKHDPRKVSKTVIIRDYGCKVPITLADTEQIARAVLNNYPDRYVDFLKEFVSNIMGEAMKKYLVTYRDALTRLIDNPTELNRVSWGAYKNVQGGHSPDLVATDKAATAGQYFNVDCTLLWEDHISSALRSVVMQKGDTMTGSLTASDVFDIRPCLQQHIATLEDMSSIWCQGFATKERYALALLWWCNEQGRNLSQDLGLLRSGDHPDYNLIELHVPLNPFHARDPDTNIAQLSPDQNCAIRGNLRENNGREVKETISYRVPVGQWTGNNETPNVLINSSKSPFAWGWGHAANLAMNVPFNRVTDASGGQVFVSTAPYLRYQLSKESWKTSPLQNTATGEVQYNQGHIECVYHYPCTVEFVNKKRWGEAFTGKPSGDNGRQDAVKDEIVAGAQARKNRTLRESLGNDDDIQSMATFYRGATSTERTYGAILPTTDSFEGNSLVTIQGIVATGTTTTPGPITTEKCNTVLRKPVSVPVDGGVCAPDGLSIVRKHFSGACRHLDPFFTNGPNCLVTKVNGKVPNDRVVNVLINSRCFSYYNISDIGTSQYFRSTVLRALANSRSYASITGTRKPPLIDIGAYLDSYRNGYYPYRTLVPPLAVTGSPTGSMSPFLELFTSASRAREHFDANFDGTELESRNPDTGALEGNDTVGETSQTVVNQPFVPSFTMDMSNIDWERTAKGGPNSNGYTDLLMNDVRLHHANRHDYLTNAMRVITVRTVLSVMLGMDTAALICEEPIPSNRLVVWLAGLPIQNIQDQHYRTFNDFACSPMVIKSALNAEQRKNHDNEDKVTPYHNELVDYLSNKKNTPSRNGTKHDCKGTDMSAPPHFTQRIVPVADDVTAGIQRTLCNWTNSVMTHNFNTKIVIEKRNVRVKGDSSYDDERIHALITQSMVICIMSRLDRFLKLVRAKMVGMSNLTGFVPTGPDHVQFLQEWTTPHLLRLAIVSRFVSPNHREHIKSRRGKDFPSATATDTGGLDSRANRYEALAQYATSIPNMNQDRLTVTADVSTSENIESDYDAYAEINELNSFYYHERVFNSVNCAVQRSPKLDDDENDPSEDTFPYDVAFHSHVGSRSNHMFTTPFPVAEYAENAKIPNPYDVLKVPMDERHMPGYNSPHLRMIESLFRDPRAFYAFNPSEWRAQCDAHKKTFGGHDILHAFAKLPAGLFTLPYFANTYEKNDIEQLNETTTYTTYMTSKGEKLGLNACLPQQSAAAYLLAQYRYQGTTDDEPSMPVNSAVLHTDFVNASKKYIEALVSHAADEFKENTHYLPVVEALGYTPPSTEQDPDHPMRGTERPYGRSVPTGGTQVSGKSNVPIAKLTVNAKFGGYHEKDEVYFPAPDPTKTMDDVEYKLERDGFVTSEQRSRLPVGGATRLNQKIFMPSTNGEYEDSHGEYEDEPDSISRGGLMRGSTSRSNAMSEAASDAANTDTQRSRFVLYPVGNHPAYANVDISSSSTYGSMLYNADVTRPQMFAMLDAAGLLWHARTFINPSDCNRPQITEANQCDGMHYWCRTLVETFVSARESYRQRNSSSLWEMDVKRLPGSAMPSTFIGNLCDDTWRAYFPLLPFDHELREDLRRCRALSVVWGNLTQYSSGADSTGVVGAWMPLAPAHQMRLYSTVGLFDGKFRVPRNPWLPNNGAGISLVFNQSYHSVYHCDSYRAEHFQDWLTSANRYQVPNIQQEGCIYPFSQYGGTPVEADFIPHIVERCTEVGLNGRHRQLVYNRFGFTSDLRIGNQFHDTGLLQDMFKFKYRPYADLSSKQRQMPEADTVHISNFMSYARTHTIIALASCNHGTQDESVPRIVRNLYRLYVDTYECMGSNTDDDSVPCIMGFSPSAINKRDDRGVVLYAGSLACLNSKLATFCSSSMNRGERVCAIYKQVYLNDATLLYTRLLRQERRKILHDNNFNRARLKRGRGYGRNNFDRDLIDLQDAYIEFLQNTVLGMLLEAGADLQGVPLHLLEPRELEVSLFQEDDNLVGNDFLTPRTKEIIAQSDFGGDNLTRTQLAILSLIPPNHRVLGTLRLNQSMEVVDLEHAKKQIQKETMESNKKVWERYSEGLISAAFAQKLLEVDGPIDFSLDMSSIQDPMRMRFDMGAFKDPLKESENIKTRMTTTHAQSSSSLSLQQRGEKLRKSVASDSVLNMTTKELNRALALVRERVERDYAAHNGTKRRIQILEMLRIPAHVRRILRPEYEGDLA